MLAAISAAKSSSLAKSLCTGLLLSFGILTKLTAISGFDTRHVCTLDANRERPQALEDYNCGRDGLPASSMFAPRNYRNQVSPRPLVLRHDQYRPTKGGDLRTASTQIDRRGSKSLLLGAISLLV